MYSVKRHLLFTCIDLLQPRRYNLRSRQCLRHRLNQGTNITEGDKDGTCRTLPTHRPNYSFVSP